MPAVSIIVPARNEEACLGACLESLLAQTGVESEVIVVDDSSTDHTRAIAESFACVRVLSPGPLAAGCSGKCNAAQAGANVARSEWLLFTDADTVHFPGSLARAMTEAREHQADLLSYSPRQEVHGLIERAVLTVIFAELASTYRPQEISDPSSPTAAANGQYLLITREAYNAVGGHAAVARTLLEDVALAQAVKRSGRRLYFRYGGDMVRTRMYRSLPALWEGWTKNLALLFPQSLQLAARREIEFLLAFAAILAAVTGGVVPQPVVASVGLFVAVPT
jgi:glycosyltransferase involved in cell wall biosynthesis